MKTLLGRHIYYHCMMLLASVLFTVNQSNAQLKKVNLVQLTEKDGLPGSQVNCMLQDRFGYVWIGTINGLARYDGIEFKRYFSNPNDTTSINGLIIWSLLEDHKGQVWVASSPEFLNVYNPVTRSFRHYGYKELVIHPANVEIGINAMCQDKKGRIYLGINTYYGDIISPGLLYMDEKDHTIKRFPAPDSLEIQNVYRITADPSGNIWFISYSGLFKIDPQGKLSRIHALDALLKNKEQPNDLKAGRNGHILFVTNRSRICDFNPRQGNYILYPKIPVPGKDTNRLVFNSIAFDTKDNAWVGTNKGLKYFDRKSGLILPAGDESNSRLAQTTINALMDDSFGTLWIGTASEGIFRNEERSVFKSISYDKSQGGSLTPGWANNIIETRDHKLWITTSGQGDLSGINKFDPVSGMLRPFPFKSFLPNGEIVFGITEKDPGELWLSTITGLYQFTVKTNAVRKITLEGVPAKSFIFQFVRDTNGDLWLCTNTGLYRKRKETTGFTRYDLSLIKGCNAGSNEITHSYLSKKHCLWLLTNNGLFLYDFITGKVRRLGYDKNVGDVFITQDINSFYEDPSGIAWVGTWQGGLSRYDPATGKIRTYTRDDGLPSMCIQGILADEQNGYLWLSTFDGLSRLDLQTGQFNNYSIADGIQSQLFSDGSYLETSNGQFVFGGSNGITLFKPGDVNKNSLPPLVFLTDFKLFNKSVLPGSSSVLQHPIYDTRDLSLSYDQNTISIEFTAIHYSNPAKNKCAYKLENYDNDWRDAGNQHIASYPKLPPGEYVFRVKAANNNGVWNEQGATLRIIISPPWWKTPLAYAFYLLMLAALVYGADRFFRHRIIRKEREKSRTHELLQAKEIEKAYTELKTTQAQLIQSEKMASLGELTAGIAHEIQNPLNFVNNFSEVNKDLIVEIKTGMEKGNLEDVKSILNDLAENEEKISHHGKRAGAIVKGMLEHSRNSSGKKEPVDINVLAEEYLRLCYSGLQAKDKAFTAITRTDFDHSIGKIKIVQQDIGRVILNLLTNAFYAVREKKKEVLDGYQPEVSVSTRNMGDRIEIKIADNGKGIPKSVVDKIFQPFFTTKPAGEGTGLGLSLSYDIITKGHGGELKVETVENDHTAFTIHLPV